MLSFSVSLSFSGNLFEHLDNSGKDAEKVCCMGLTALDRPAVTLYQDPKRAAAQADVARQGSALRGSTACVDGDNEAAGKTKPRGWGALRAHYILLCIIVMVRASFTLLTMYR